jgi:hypothetical protein
MRVSDVKVVGRRVMFMCVVAVLLSVTGRVFIGSQ